MFAMAGASLAHSMITANLLGDLQQQLRRTLCRVLTSDTRVSVPSGLYTYPDALVVCGEPQLLEGGNPDTLLNPTLIVEVLSPSTEAYDRGRKFEHYQTIVSLKQYLLVASDRCRIDLFTRRPEGWVLSSADQLDSTISLDSIRCKLALADVFERVQF